MHRKSCANPPPTLSLSVKCQNIPILTSASTAAAYYQPTLIH